ncbi:MAG: hypothetical protein HOP07_02320 [Bacteriovoracaceae bacterium]|nr:hypothetical protein [Bacteriovoracaceae bacterium]
MIFIRLVLISLAVFHTSLILAETTQSPCLTKDGSLGLNTLEKYDCNLVQEIIKDPKVKSEFTQEIQKKLAQKLSKKVSESLEEIGLLDAYFDSLGLDLSQNSSDVQKNCQLKEMARPKCALDEIAKKKIAVLSSFFPTMKKEKIRGKVQSSLLGGMIAKSSEVRGSGNSKNINECPGESQAGKFFIEAQFSNVDAKELITGLKSGKGRQIRRTYELYPQLKMISEIPQLLSIFEKEMIAFIPGNLSEKEFVDQFIKRPETQMQLAKKLADKCEAIATNIDDFICKEPVHLATTEADRKALLGSKEDLLNKEIARGYSCAVTDEKELVKEQTIGAWFASFSKDLRDEVKSDEVALFAEPFCNLFSCKDEQVKKLPSCKTGGPIKGQELHDLLCLAKSDNCTSKIQKYISYLKLIEKDAAISLNQGSLASSTPENNSSGAKSEKPSGYSSFYQNFLGVEGTLLAEGKVLTPSAIENKRAEFQEKKIGSDANLNLAEKIEPKVSPSATLAPGRDNESISTQALARTPSGQDSFVTSSNNQMRKIPYQVTIPRKAERASGFSQSTPASNSQSGNDIKELQAELAKVVKGLNGSDEQNLKTVSQNNQVVVGNVPKSSGTSDMTRAERERLERYRQSLGAWENRLQNWSSDLRQREVQGFNGSKADETPKDALAINNGKGVSPGNKASSVLSMNSGNAKGAKITEGGNEQAADKFLADDGSIILNSENLSSFGRETLSKIGILSQESFILNVRHENRIYAIPVQSFKHKGKSIFVPLLNEKNRNLAKIVIESPLFSDYRNYRAETEVSSL